jgi:hypothetical protein
VNTGFFDRCTPGTTTGRAGEQRATSVCPGGTEELSGTGFGPDGAACGFFGKRATTGGATGWLSSQAPVEPDETFTLELVTWDTGDARSTRACCATTSSGSAERW